MNNADEKRSLNKVVLVPDAIGHGALNERYDVVRLNTLLAHKTAGTVTKGSLAIFRDVMAGKDDHHDAGIVGLDAASQLQAIFVGQFDVHENDVGTALRNGTQGTLAILRLLHIQLGKLVVKHVVERMAESVIIFNQKCTEHSFFLINQAVAHGLYFLETIDKRPQRQCDLQSSGWVFQYRLGEHPNEGILIPYVVSGIEPLLDLNLPMIRLSYR